MHKKILGKKHSEKEERFLHVWENIEDYVSFGHIAKRQAQAIKWIRSITAGKKAAFTYSGGKDSCVLQHLCRLAGIEDGMAAMTQELEFPVFEKWVPAQIGPRVKIYRTPFTMEWLGKHPEWLFIKDMARLRPRTIWGPQERYIKEHGIEVALYGRRTIDGNYCGKAGVYDKQGVLRFNPIYDWSHEEVFAYLHYMNIPIAPTYYFPRPPALKEGWFYHGTTPWIKVEVKESIPAKDRVQKSWEVIYALDKSIVEKAAKHIPSARQYLGGVQVEQ